MSSGTETMCKAPVVVHSILCLAPEVSLDAPVFLSSTTSIRNILVSIHVGLLWVDPWWHHLCISRHS